MSVAVASFFWATSGTSAKFLFRGGITAFELVQLRTTIAALLLFLSLYIFDRSLLRVGRKDFAYLVLLGAILAAVQFTYLFTISLIPVAAAILIQYLSPVMIALHGRIVRKIHLSPAAVAAIAGAIAGCYLMVGGYNLAVFSLNRAGLFSGILSAAVFAWYSVKSEDGMQKYSPWTILSYALLMAAVIWNLLHTPLQAFGAAHDLRSWGLILYIALFGTVLPFGLYNHGIRSIRATYASITAMLEPVCAAIFAYAVLGEVLKPLQIAGGLLVIASVILIQVRGAGRADTGSVV
jgi:drug/metabolite transporter (DMT)-like permease